MNESSKLWTLGLGEAARGIREREFSAEALTQSLLERIRQLDKDILAWAWLDADQAIAKARTADALLKNGAIPGPLHGVPLGIKDIIHTKGIPTRMGSPIFERFIPDRSATCVTRLEAAGAFVLGKTVTTEFASQRAGKTRNPLRPERTPGGSSSGSAAAVAAGFVPGALGTQTRGSTIRPAAYCGIVGYKPSFGLISRYGVKELSGSLDHVGVLARTVGDAALLASCLAGYDPSDKATLANQPPIFGLDDLPALEQAPRLAAVRSPVWPLAEKTQQDSFIKSVQKLRDGGAHVEDIELSEAFDQALEIARAIQLSEIAHNYKTLMDEFRSDVSPQFTAYFEKGSTYTAVEYLEALSAQERLKQELSDVLARFDAIVTPPATGEAPIGLEFTGDANFCTIWTLCGVPCVTIPTGCGPHGMPLGLQVVGRHRDDRQLMRVAAWCAARFADSGSAEATRRELLKL